MPVVGRCGSTLLLFIALAMFSGCGGGGTGGSLDGSTPPVGGNPLPPKILSWQPPTSYTDSTPMNPAIDLDRFEIYVHTSGTFADTDIPQAIVSAVDPATHNLSTSFNLANLSPGVTAGPVYYVSVRAVAISGLKSDFSLPASFSF